MADKSIAASLGWKIASEEFDFNAKDLAAAVNEVTVDGDIENVSDYGVHKQLDDAVWQAVPNREYAILENFVVNNPADTWHQPKPVTIICPSTLKGIVQAVKDAEQNNWKIRGLASCHSFSDAPRTKNCYIYLTDDTLIKSIMGSRGAEILMTKDTLEVLKDFDTFPANTTGVNPRYIFKKADLVEVAGGCTINELNDRLCRYDTDLSQITGVRRLLNMGGGDVQTFAGAFATGTHGTGGKHSAYHDMIKSVVIVCTGGRVFRVEPTNGITDKTKHDARFVNGNPAVKIELIQDDERFNSLLVSFGSFGIIHSAVIETTQMDLLHEELVYKRSGYKDVKGKFETMLPDFVNCRQDFFTNVLINPYKLKKNSDHSVTVKTVTVANGKPINRKEDRRNFWPTFMTGKKFTAEIMRGLANGPLNKRTIVEGALKNLSDHEGNGKNGYTDFSYRIWNAGGGETKSMGCGIEFAFRPNEIEEVLAAIFDLLDDIYRPGLPANKRYLNSPMSIRFVRSSEAYLAPNYKLHPDHLAAEQDVWCYIELLRINSKKGVDDVKEREVFYMLQDLLYKSGGRPHWGLNFSFPFTLEFLRELYPKLDIWIDSFKFFNPTGLFDNSLTDRCGFRSA